MTRNANIDYVGYDIFRRKDNNISHEAFSMYLFLFQIYKQCNMT